MVEINIPGQELDDANSNMQKVLQLFGNDNASALDLETALGSSDTLVTKTAKNFESRWNTGRSQIKDDGQKIIDAINKIEKTFTDTDNDLAQNLTPDSGAPSS